MRRHWQTALALRDHMRLSEEAYHLIIAAGTGLIAGLVYAGFHGANTLLQWLAWGETGQFLQIAKNQPAWRLALVPAVGGLLAGLVLVPACVSWPAPA